LILGKSTTAVAIMPPELQFLTPIGIKSFVGWGFAPDSTGGAYSAPPDFLAIFRGPTSKERGDEGENKKGGKGRERRVWERREGERRGREGREFVLCPRKKRSRRLRS